MPMDSVFAYILTPDKDKIAISKSKSKDITKLDRNIKQVKYYTKVHN